MSGPEFAPGNSASDYEPQPYSEQLFEPSSLLTEFQQRQDALSTYVNAEVGAYYFHQAICARIVQIGRYPRDIPFENDVRRAYPIINYDPGDSEERRFIRLAKHLCSDGVEIPMLAATTPTELEQRLPVAKERSFSRSDLLLVHGAMRKRTIPGAGQNNLIELFLSHSPTDEVVQQRCERQRQYVGWLKIAAAEIGMPNKAPNQLRPYYPGAQAYDICLQ